MAFSMKSDYNTLANPIPVDWSEDRLKDIVSLQNDKTAEASEEEDYLELEDMQSGTGRILNRRNTMATVSAVTVFRKGDILFGKLRPYLEKYYEAEFDGRCTGEILAFHPERIEGRFLFYTVASPQFIDRCNMLAYGAKMPRVNWPTQLAQFNIPLPPRHDQKRIAAFLDASCTALDTATTAKRRQIEALEALRQSSIESAVLYGIAPNRELRPVNGDWLASLPRHWEACRIKRIVSRVDYGISRSTNSEGSFPVLKMGHVQDGEIAFSDFDFVDEVSDELLLKKGDLIYNRTNSHDQVGKAAVFRGNFLEPLTFASYLVRLRTNHRADPYWLNYVVNSQGFLGFARKMAIPSVQQANLNSTRYCRLVVPLPPIGEQKEIAAFLDDKITEIKRIEDSIQRQISTLFAYRKSLIHECVTGQRRITEEDLNRVLKNG